MQILDGLQRKQPPKMCHVLIAAACSMSYTLGDQAHGLTSFPDPYPLQVAIPQVIWCTMLVVCIRTSSAWYNLIAQTILFTPAALAFVKRAAGSRHTAISVKRSMS